MRLIVGLGNPGDEYAATRHNAGFRVVEALAAEEHIRIRAKECSSRVGRGRIGPEPVLLALPQTYMNASGEAVSGLCQKHSVEPSELCVVVDDIDLPLGALRLRARGSAGSQKGLRSVVAHLGTTEFPRLRVGIRGERYSRERNDLADYVLEPVAKAERDVYEESIGRAVEALRLWLTQGIDAAMRRSNVLPSSPDRLDPD
ncbi:MAG TPA: aminoacyl-tRNA hydrolase [Thermoanaerobaculia bacterium]|nr:aminoacyl-tRNA hydrolase [Thermoanaerobaculia bacterium]